MHQTQNANLQHIMFTVHHAAMKALEFLKTQTGWFLSHKTNQLMAGLRHTVLQYSMEIGK